jgi:murein peptide amidase A
MTLEALRPGQSVSGDSINAFIGPERGDKYLYLMAGVHGDEVEGVYVLQELQKWIEEHEDWTLPVIIVPILNVDGYRNQTRVNAHGVDLNRNLPSSGYQTEYTKPEYFPGSHALSEPENQFLVKLFDKFTPGLILSFHSWKPILNYNGDCLDVATFLEQFNHYPVEGDIGYPTPGSLGQYAPEEYECPVLTFECPRLSDNISLKDIWQENRDGLLQLLTSQLLKRKLGLPEEEPQEV